MDDIKELVKGCWGSIFNNLGISVGNGRHQGCPVCSPGDPTSDRFRFIDEFGTGSWFCNQGHNGKQAGDGWDLLMLCLDVDFPGAVKMVESVIGKAKKTPINNGLQYKPELLRQMYKDSKPLDGLCLASQYLRNRGLKTFPPTLRYLPECFEPSTKTRLPAMLATFSAADSEAITLQRTYLKAGGYKADLDHCKLTLTPKKPMSGGAVRLFPATVDVGLCEGIETAIACHERFDLPTWAVLSTSLMVAWEPPPGIQNILIFADNDQNYAGQKASYTLANKLYLKGYSASVEVPAKAGTDFLDQQRR